MVVLLISHLPVVSAKRTSRSAKLYFDEVPPPIRCENNDVPTVGIDETTLPEGLVFDVLPQDTHIQEEAPEEPSYIWGEPLPLTLPADDSHFSDAVFIGDSRTQGLGLFYGKLALAFYAEPGLNISTASTKAVVDDIVDGEVFRRTIPEMLTLHPDFGKVYISFGVNELGWDYTSVFSKAYELLIDEIRTINPAAEIYALNIFPVSDEISNQKGSYRTNENVARFNKVISDICRNKNICLLNVNEAFYDENGCNMVNNSISPDGIHLNKKGAEIVMNYLRTHVYQGEKVVIEPEIQIVIPIPLPPELPEDIYEEEYEYEYNEYEEETEYAETE